ncbi:MAG TPA: amidohydrolase family protein [Thermoanaerobaculia bacterium]|jgi:imidazolonepropionase-like amidohydrolase
MRRILLLLLAATGLFADEASDLRNARAVFEENIAAIHAKDRNRYLAVYLNSDKLVRTGPGGFQTGYEEFAKGAGGAWPDTLEATDLRLTPIRPGVVYGTYRYRVRTGANETSGISERIFVDTPQGWRVALTGAIGTPGVPPSPRAITGATLIDGRGGAPVPNATIVVRDGKIECINCPVPAGVDVVDARGMFVTPGLVDAHVHFSQTGWTDGRPDAFDLRAEHPYEKVLATLEKNPERFARSYLCSGVTGVFDVGGYPWTLRLAERFAEDTAAPHVRAAGPLLSTRDHWLNVPAARQFVHLSSEEIGRSGVRYLAAAGANAVKVWFIVSRDLPVEASTPWVMAAGNEARKQNLPLIVHATGLAEAKAALRAGAKLLVHSVWEPIDDEFIALARQNGTIVTPTLTVSRGYTRLYGSVVSRTAPAIDDNGCVDKVTRANVASTATLPATLANAEGLQVRETRVAALELLANMNLKKMVAAGIPIATGTDAGNPLTLHGASINAELEAMQSAGMTAMQVVVASTSVAARAAGIDKVTGTIEPGKSADLLLLAADPTKDVRAFRQLRQVMRAGVIRGVEELRAMAAQ